MGYIIGRVIDFHLRNEWKFEKASKRSRYRETTILLQIQIPMPVFV